MIRLRKISYEEKIQTALLVLLLIFNVSGVFMYAGEGFSLFVLLTADNVALLVCVIRKKRRREWR